MIRAVFLKSKLDLVLLENILNFEALLKGSPKLLLIKTELGVGCTAICTQNPIIAKIGLTPHPLILAPWRIWPIKVRKWDKWS